MALQKKPESRPKPKRDAKGRLLKGGTANPGGRPKGLAAYIREKTSDLTEVAEFMLATMRGRPVIGEGEEMSIHHIPAMRDRLDAAKWLADRAIGKTPDVVALEATHHGEDGPRLKEMTSAALLKLLDATEEPRGDASSEAEE